jgi:hypothetical protein
MDCPNSVAVKLRVLRGRSPSTIDVMTSRQANARRTGPVVAGQFQLIAYLPIRSCWAIASLALWTAGCRR